MEFIHFIDSYPLNDSLLRTFSEYVNIAYTVAAGDGLPVTGLDDAGSIAGCRASLKKACEKAKKEVLFTPHDQRNIFHHVFLIESELIDVFAVAPGACGLFGLALRAKMAEIAEHFRGFCGIPLDSEIRN
jgi:hypothetical protein